MQARKQVEVKARSSSRSARTTAPISSETTLSSVGSNGHSNGNALTTASTSRTSVSHTAIRASEETQIRPTGEFKVGDKAVYPARGVAEIVSIEEKDIAGNRQRFYVLRLLDTDHKIMVPVSNASNIGLRHPISDSEIQEIFRILKVTDIQFDNQTWNRRYRGFMDKIKTGSVFEVAEVLRDLSRLKANKALSFGERQMLEKARGLIVKEIAVARGKSEDNVRSEIEAIFDVS